ncbi:transcription factor medA [Coccidioides posadasii str. Silveira]|uniref:Transcription factor medA n=1 Tax=Coccidioides posadasii (strain RMSCC 757 / Silveira) TaxID=443226 RepID=E9DF31_COCPS|nr:transcription factor medA [Coccidioides posadasii str. Silveira]
MVIGFCRTFCSQFSKSHTASGFALEACFAIEGNQRSTYWLWRDQQPHILFDLSTVTLAYSKGLTTQFDLDFQSPLIFDESVDFSDPEESRFAGTFSDGLWAKTGGPMSMSTYEKCQPTDLLDYDGTTGALYQGALPAYAQAPYSGQLFTPVLESHPVSDDESIHYVGNRGYAGSPFDFPRSPSLEASTRPPPEVVSFDPANGRKAQN